MAKLDRGFNQTALKGSVGAVTYTRQKGTGDTIAKQKVPKHVIARQTIGLMRQRMQWANIISMWRALNVVGWHPSFPTRNLGQSDYNAFVSRNVGRNRVWLTRDEVRGNACVVAPYMLTNGSLQSIVVSIDSTHQAVSDIAVGSLTIGASTTLVEFSQAIVTSNHGRFAYGDQLTLVVATQNVDGVSGEPTCVVKCYEVTLQETDPDSRLLEDILGANVYRVADGFLCGVASIIGGVAMVHSRETADGVQVSTQSLVVDNPTLAQYQSGTAFETAVKSYGGLAEPYYLTPNIDNVYVND